MNKILKLIVLTAALKEINKKLNEEAIEHTTDTFSKHIVNLGSPKTNDLESTTSTNLSIR